MLALKLTVTVQLLARCPSPRGCPWWRGCRRGRSSRDFALSLVTEALKTIRRSTWLAPVEVARRLVRRVREMVPRSVCGRGARGVEGPGELQALLVHLVEDPHAHLGEVGVLLDRERRRQGVGGELAAPLRSGWCRPRSSRRWDCRSIPTGARVQGLRAAAPDEDGGEEDHGPGQQSIARVSSCRTIAPPAGGRYRFEGRRSAPLPEPAPDLARGGLSSRGGAGRPGTGARRP